jgi:hypothetical protein
MLLDIALTSNAHLWALQYGAVSISNALSAQTTSTVRSVAHGNGVMVLTLATEFKIITPRLMALLRALLAERIPRCSMTFQASLTSPNKCGSC